MEILRLERLKKTTHNKIFLQAGVQFLPKVLAINYVFSKYKVFVFLARLQKYPTVIANFMNDTLNYFKVTDRQSFIKLLDLLRKDFLDNPESWENKTLPDFLEALSAYAEDIQGYYDNMKLNVSADKPDWSTFADIFKGAKIYE